MAWYITTFCVLELIERLWAILSFSVALSEGDGLTIREKASPKRWGMAGAVFILWLYAIGTASAIYAGLAAAGVGIYVLLVCWALGVYLPRTRAGRQRAILRAHGLLKVTEQYVAQAHKEFDAETDRDDDRFDAQKKAAVARGATAAELEAIDTARRAAFTEAVSRHAPALRMSQELDLPQR